MQYTEFFSAVKVGKFYWETFDVFNIFAQNSVCGYTLEPPRRGGSNEYPRYMYVLDQNKKSMYTPENPTFTIKSGV